MLTRIVKMQFDPARTEDFRKLFFKNRHRITESEGCYSVELLRDINQDHIFFTYSHWKDADALNAYRSSDTFKDIWGKTKPMFTERAQAWSVVPDQE